MKPIDIVIVNYNSTDHLLNCLMSIRDVLSGTPARIHIQDNGSVDGVDRVEALFPEVILTKNTRNLGFAKAVNRGMAQGVAPYLLILNPDTVVSGGFFESVLAYMEENPDTGILGPKIRNRDGSVQGSARAFPTPLTALFGRNSILSRFFPGNPITRKNLLTADSDGVSPMDVDWVSGASIIVRRKAVEDVGPLDERFFMYWEDADWCRRMWQKGWKVVYFPRAEVAHYVGASSDTLLTRSQLEFHKSTYRLFVKYNRPSRRFLNPIAFLGLSLRLGLVLSSRQVRSWLGKHAGRVALRKNQADHQVK